MLIGLSGFYIRESIATIVPVIKECEKKLCHTTVSIELIKDTTLVGRKTPTGSQIHYPLAAATILQAWTLSSKMASAKKITGIPPLSKFLPYISIAVSFSLKTKDFTSGTLCLDTSAAVSIRVSAPLYHSSATAQAPLYACTIQCSRKGYVNASVRPLLMLFTIVIWDDPNNSFGNFFHLIT